VFTFKKFQSPDESMDSQHGIFFTISKGFSTAVAKKASLTILAGIADQCVNYARAHFDSEETAMVKHGYPDLEPHRQAHVSLFSSMSEHAGKLKAGRESPEAFAAFLSHWFTQHLAEDDKKFADFLRDRNISTSS
jgi:hemerythrin-like metal-binding protein